LAEKKAFKFIYKVGIDQSNLSTGIWKEEAHQIYLLGDGTCPEDNRKLNRFEFESDEQCEQWLLPETIAIGSRSIQSEHKAVSN
jgi:hypothetical protein